jgi:ferric-dicitrate binding protein FerR (iron transport regulator)
VQSPATTEPGDDARRDTPAPAPVGRRSRNVRTALVMLSIALVFFVGVIVNRLLNG